MATETAAEVTVTVSYLIRRDEQVKAFVAYVPLLDRFTQARTEAELKEVVTDMISSLNEIILKRGWKTWSDRIPMGKGDIK